MKYRRAVFVVAYKKEKIKRKSKILYLLLKRKLHWKGWEFPKGGLNNGESVLAAVKRELKEETGNLGLNIRKYNFSGKYDYDKEIRDRKGFKGQTFILFSAELKSKKIKLDSLEHSAFKWLDFDKAFSMLKWANQKRALVIVNNKLEK